VPSKPDKAAPLKPDKAGPLQPLHGGRHKLPPDLVAFNQRERLLAATASLVATNGYNAMTVARITETASVSSRTFYEHFVDKEACFLAAYDAVDTYLLELLTSAVAAHEEWSEQVATVLAELIAFFAAHPDLARLTLVEAAVVGEGTLTRREQSAERLIALLAAGRAQRSDDRELPEGIEEALIGGVMTLLSRRVTAGEGTELERFAPAAIEFALTPYLGVAEARAVAAKHA
jgi:AcrR family transcriptional regulator